MKKSKWTISRTMALLAACVMTFGMASCSKKETTTETTNGETFWPETKSHEVGDTQKKETTKSAADTEEYDSIWGTTHEEEGDSRAGQSFEESREAGDRAPDEIIWEQGDTEWIADDNTLRVVNGVFYMDDSILGMPYDFANKFFGGDLPLLDKWEWDNRYTGYCNYCYRGTWYTFFFSGENLTAVRYEIEGDDVEKFLSIYTDRFGAYGYRKDPNTGADIDHEENGYGYVMNADYSTLVVFLNVYDGLPHIAMQYEYPTYKVETLAPEDLGNDRAPEDEVDDSALASAPAATSNYRDDNAMTVVDNIFFMDIFYLGCDYTYVNGKLGGDLPLLDAWTWDDRFSGYCDYYYNGHWYTLFFNDTTLAAVRYEFEGDDLERFLDPYIEKYGAYDYRKDPNTGSDIDLFENGYGYKFDTGEGSFVIFLNVYDDVPHIAMQYELWK